MTSLIDSHYQIATCGYRAPSLLQLALIVQALPRAQLSSKAKQSKAKQSKAKQSKAACAFATSLRCPTDRLVVKVVFTCTPEKPTISHTASLRHTSEEKQERKKT